MIRADASIFFEKDRRRFNSIIPPSPEHMNKAQELLRKCAFGALPEPGQGAARGGMA
jgi:hypothetical protein